MRYILVCVAVLLTVAAETTKMNPNLVGKFLYFGYGSNLLAQRIHIQNPSAERYGAGVLENHRLDFGPALRDNWRGASATIVPEEGSKVWGAIWTINNADLENLDDQEGVSMNWYVPKTVEVQSLNGEIVTCRTYHLKNQPEKITPGEEIPFKRLPSKLYLQVMINGARQSGLPEQYIAQMEKISHNNATDGPYAEFLKVF